MKTVLDILGMAFPGLAILPGEPMSRHCSFRTGGNADLYARPADEGQLVAAVKEILEARA